MTDHLTQLTDRGWTRIEAAYPAELLDRVIDESDRLESIYAPVQQHAGVYDDTRNAYHHTLLVCPSMLELLDPNPVGALLTDWFGGAYILNTMGTSYVQPAQQIYTQQVHRDVRSHTGELRLLVNTLIMLDDSTPENGATLMMSGSQHLPDQPDRNTFDATAEVAGGRRGDVLVFDGNLWHAAGQNQSSTVRRIITALYTRPYLKQQLDYPRAFGYDLPRRISPELAQVLGYNALVPTRLDEFYKPRDQRFYKPDQG